MHQSSSFDLEKFPNHSNCGFIVIFGHELACLSPFLQALITPILKIGNSHLGRRKNRPILMLDLEIFGSFVPTLIYLGITLLYQIILERSMIIFRSLN